MAKPFFSPACPWFAESLIPHASNGMFMDEWREYRRMMEDRRLPLVCVSGDGERRPSSRQRDPLY